MRVFTFALYTFVIATSRSSAAFLIDASISILNLDIAFTEVVTISLIYLSEVVFSWPNAESRDWLMRETALATFASVWVLLFASKAEYILAEYELKSCFYVYRDVSN